MIIEEISKIANVDYSEVLTSCRNKELVEVRQISSWIMRENFTLQRIGKVFNQNHATVVHSIKKIDDMISIGDRHILGILETYYKCH